MNTRAIFIGADGRARAPWRMILFLVIWVLLATVAVGALGHPLREADRLSGVTGTGGSIAMVISLLLAHWAMLWLDRRGFAYVSLHREAASPRALAAGFGVGAAPIALASLILIAIGWLDIVPAEPGSWTVAAIQVSLALLPAALYEELLSRGYLFATLGEWLGRPVAIAVTSIAFGLLHLWNPGATAFSITTVIIAGVFLAAVLVVTGSLYAAWMAHWAWNWVMAVPLHVSVSGLPLARPDYQTVDDGPDWITGGQWGPEGGATAAAAMIAGLVFLYMQRKRFSALDSRLSAEHRDRLPGEQADDHHFTRAEGAGPST